MTTYFSFTVKILPESANLEFLAGKCAHVLHGFQKKNELNAIFLDFPKWNDSTIGDELRFLSSDKRFLLSFKEQRIFIEMSQQKYFEVSEVIQANLDEIKYFYYRDRRHEKLTSAALNRMLSRVKKRAEVRSESYIPVIASEPVLALPFCHFIPIKSSGEHQYYLAIARTTLFACNISSYGLIIRDNVHNN